MSASEWVEAGKALGLVVGVWFAPVGWKLVPLVRAGRPGKL